MSLPEGRTAMLIGLCRESAHEGDCFTTYNFEVADTNTYFVGESGVWVHNASSLVCGRAEALYLKLTDATGPHKLSPADGAKKLNEWLLTRQKRHGWPADELEKHRSDIAKSLVKDNRINQTQAGEIFGADVGRGLVQVKKAYTQTADGEYWVAKHKYFTPRGPDIRSHHG